ncbi:transcription antitermination factor NusB [Enterorhabdus sp. P55]|uniref:transcription antitermination factor NusB n=1 Tax=Enterorhabdus sp. P55 TaxID=2304571 RepID=UPI00136BF1D0
MHDDRRAPEGRRRDDRSPREGRDDRRGQQGERRGPRSQGGQDARGGQRAQGSRGQRDDRRPRRDEGRGGGDRRFRDDRGRGSQDGQGERGRGSRSEGPRGFDGQRSGRPGDDRGGRPQGKPGFGRGRDQAHGPRPEGDRHAPDSRERRDAPARGPQAADERAPRPEGDSPRRDDRGPRAGGDRERRGPRDADRRQAPPRRGRATEARGLALEAIHQLRERHAFAQDVIASTIDTSKIAREERAFATRLVLGVTSTRGTLDDVIDGCMDSPDDASPAVRDALALSAYEIIFLQKSPHAAVDQGVELVKSVAPRAGGLANAVLRRVVRAKESFPFGDPRTDLRAYARLHGFPAWLAERLIKDLGPQGAHDLMTASNEPAPVYVAVNAAKATDEEVVSILAAAHGQPEPVEVAGRRVEGCYCLASGLALLDGRVRRMLSQGLLLVSDATSQAVASLVVGEEEPASFLEIGAGRATKTILDQSCAQRRFGHQVSGYVTVDAHAFKTKLLRERAAQFGIEVEDALTGDGCDLGALVGERLFDRVFVDAPCTGLGTLRRHADIRWRLRPDTIAEQAALGARLLDSAAAHVAPGGTLAYATCTVTTEENAAVVEAFLASEQGAGFEIIPFARPDLGVELPFFSVALEPGGPDAHFLALLRRRS